MRQANEGDARENGEVYRHSQPHTILAVERGRENGPHIRVDCPREMPACRGFIAIGEFLARDT